MEGYRIATVRVTPLEHHAEPPAGTAADTTETAPTPS